MINQSRFSQYLRIHQFFQGLQDSRFVSTNSEESIHWSKWNIQVIRTHTPRHCNDLLGLSLSDIAPLTWVSCLTARTLMSPAAHLPPVRAQWPYLLFQMHASVVLLSANVCCGLDANLDLALDPTFPTCLFQNQSYGCGTLEAGVTWLGYQ